MAAGTQVGIAEDDNKNGSFVWNPHLKKMRSDYLYHLSLGTATHDLVDMFGDVKFVCVGGTKNRMQSLAHILKDELAIRLPTGVALFDMTQNANRYSMYKIGPVLCVSHGMGSGSLSILMHELLKLITYAECRDVVFLRLGTSGGLGVDAGTVIVTDRGLDGLLRPIYEITVLGQIVRVPVLFDQDLVQELVAIGSSLSGSYGTLSGATMCTSDFYEGQARMDGAFCSFDEEQKSHFLYQLHAAGVLNIEMEATTFGAMCHAAGVSGAIICVTLLNRLAGDQIVIPEHEYEELTRRPLKLAAKFIKKRMANTF